MLLTWPQQTVAGKGKEVERDPDELPPEFDAELERDPDELPPEFNAEHLRHPDADPPAFYPMTPSLRRSCFERLNIGLHEELSESRINQAFRVLSLSLHPDKCRDDQTKLKMFHELNNMRSHLLREVQLGLRFVTDYPVFRNSDFAYFARGSAAAGGAAAGGAAAGGAAARVPMAQQEFWQQAWQTLESEVPLSLAELRQHNTELRAKNAELKERMARNLAAKQKMQEAKSMAEPGANKENAVVISSDDEDEQACDASASMEAGMDMDEDMDERAGSKRRKTARE
jgi:hypothetical protein